MVPGKDPNGWSFSLEPYAWAMGLDGEVGVHGLPAMDVNLSANLLQNLDWAILGGAKSQRALGGFSGTASMPNSRLGRPAWRAVQVSKP